MGTLIFRPYEPHLPNQRPPGIGPRLGALSEPKNPENHNAVVGKVWQACHPKCKLNFIAAPLAGRPATDLRIALAWVKGVLRVFSTAALAHISFVGGFDDRADQDQSPLSNSA